MARQRRDNFDDTFGLEGTAAPGGVAVEQPPPLRPDVLRDVRQELAEKLNIPVESLDDLARSKELGGLIHLSSDVLGQVQHLHSEREAKLIREQCGKSAQERTQDVVNANKAWQSPDNHKYRCWLQTNPGVAGKAESVTLEIPARSIEEAESRYRKACGIITTEHFIRVLPVEEYQRRLKAREEARRRQAEEAEMAEMGE